MQSALAIEQVLRRDRMVTAAGLAVVTALAWLYLFDMASDMAGTAAAMGGMMKFKPWTVSYAFMMFVMWAVMMVGMMVPSAAPVILLHARVWRKRSLSDAPYAPTTAFAAGYIVIWTVFGAAATAAQWGLESTALMSPMMASVSAQFSGLVLVAAGLYQLTPLKNACLHRCRSPVEFLARRWRHGRGGAFAMGLEHGLFCLGCCWVLMALLFVGGVMDLLWVAAIAVLVLAEKVAPFGRGLSKASAVLFVGAGLWLIVGA